MLKKLKKLKSLNLHSILNTILVASLCAGSINCIGIQGPVRAPNPVAKAVNQNTIHKNGCGIASLINAYRFATPKWKQATRKIVGNTDREQFNYIAKNYGAVRSRYTPATRRWESSSGISSVDLVDLANDFQHKQNIPLPNLRLTTYYKQPNETYTALLKRTHRQLRSDLKSGFPPIISIKHLISNKIEGHIVILYEIPSSIPNNASSFPIKYIDPLGGIIKSGIIKVPGNPRTFSKLKQSKPRTLTMHLPQSNMAKKDQNTGDNIVLSSSIAP